MRSKNLSTVQIGSSTFVIDCQYQAIMNLISDEWQEVAIILNHLFEKCRKDQMLRLVEAVMEDGCTDIPMIYFCSMVLQNYRELQKSEAIVFPMYHQNPSDLLAQCAYANQFLFRKKPREMIKAFGGTFDLEIICETRKLPLITFLHFMSLASIYYNAVDDVKGIIQCGKYVTAADPNHPDAKEVMNLVRKRTRHPFNLSRATGNC